MTGPVVSPWIIYLINICSHLVDLCAIGCCLGVIILAVWYYICWEKIPTTEIVRRTELKILNRRAVFGIIGLFVLLCGATFIPDRTTAVQMFIANAITYENIEKFTNYVDKTTDKVLDHTLENTTSRNGE